MSATDELRRLLDERGVEWHQVTPQVTATDDWLYSEVNGTLGVWSQASRYTPAQAVDATLGPKITGETSDGYHTFDELYHHRAVLFSVIVRDHPEIAWKAKKHHDGTMYEGMFIVGVDTPEGQATYHYDIDPYWDMFECRELDAAPEWDGHTPDDAIARIATLGRDECEDVGGADEFCCSECGCVLKLTDSDGLNTLCTGFIVDCPHYCPSCGREVRR